MAEVIKIEQADESQGIKLFGKTIVFKVKVEEPTKIANSDGESLGRRRPDGIVACPRCKSMDTKFCYFNNYNVNQPRHFCKGCQRYWTAGGALRNVPVGAGRRKIKPGPTRTFPLPDSSQSMDSLFDAGVNCFQEYWTHHPRQQQQQLLLATGTPGFHPDFPAVKRRRNIGPTGQTNC